MWPLSCSLAISYWPAPQMDAGLTLHFSASTRPGNLKRRGLLDGPGVLCLAPYLCDLEPTSQDTPFDMRNSACKARSTLCRQILLPV